MGRHDRSLIRRQGQSGECWLLSDSFLQREAQLHSRSLCAVAKLALMVKMNANDGELKFRDSADDDVHANLCWESAVTGAYALAYQPR